MEIHHAKKVVIITEKLISEDVCELIKDSHASGYTICSVGGSSERNVKSSDDGASVVGDFSNVKIEAILKDQDEALHLIEMVVEEFFTDFSGICFIEDVQVLRTSKF